MFLPLTVAATKLSLASEPPVELHAPKVSASSARDERVIISFAIVCTLLRSLEILLTTGRSSPLDDVEMRLL